MDVLLIELVFLLFFGFLVGIYVEWDEFFYWIFDRVGSGCLWLIDLCLGSWCLEEVSVWGFFCYEEEVCSIRG